MKIISEARELFKDAAALVTDVVTLPYRALRVTYRDARSELNPISAVALTAAAEGIKSAATTAGVAYMVYSAAEAGGALRACFIAMAGLAVGINCLSSGINILLHTSDREAHMTRTAARNELRRAAAPQPAVLAR